MRTTEGVGGRLTMSGSVTVPESTILSDLLQLNMGVRHWAACTEGVRP